MGSVQAQNLANTPNAIPLVDKDTGVITFNWNQWLTNVQIKINTINANLISVSNQPLVNTTPGTYGDATHVPQLVLDTYGRITGVINIPVNSNNDPSILTTHAYTIIQDHIGDPITVRV